MSHGNCNKIQYFRSHIDESKGHQTKLNFVDVRINQQMTLTSNVVVYMIIKCSYDWGEVFLIYVNIGLAAYASKN